jgi:hypothetical protein
VTVENLWLQQFFERVRVRMCAREAVGVAGGVVGLVLVRGAHPKRAAQPGRAVEPLDVLEDRRAQLSAGRPATRRRVVQQSGREERLGDRIVVTGADRAHRLADAGVVAGLAERQPDLPAVIGMMDRSRRGLASPSRPS